jgi:hypothetical protein
MDPKTENEMILWAQIILRMGDRTAYGITMQEYCMTSVHFIELGFLTSSNGGRGRLKKVYFHAR